MIEGNDNFEMEDMGREYPEYFDMNDYELNNEYDLLTNERLDLLRNDNPIRLEEVKRRQEFIERLQNTREAETTFTDNDDGKTVTITRKGGRSHSAPDIEFVSSNINNPGNQVSRAIEIFISDNTKEGFKFGWSDKSIEMRLRSNKTSANNITFKPRNTRNELGKPQIVLKRDANGKLQYNDAMVARDAVEQFKELEEEVISEHNIRKSMPMVNTDNNQLEWEDENGNINNDVIKGLSPNEIRELRGVLFPSDTIDPKTRIRPDGVLQIQIDHISETIGYTEREFDRTNTSEAREVLKERIDGLKEARELVSRQKQLEEVREQQEEDISRLQKFKKWAKENIAGISILAISIASIITTVLIGARTAISKAGQVTSKFAKAVANLGKKLWPVLGPLLNVLAQAISWGAKGLAWLASNLWVLAIASAWFVYDQYKQRK